MNIFNKKRARTLEMLSLGLHYCPQYYTLFVLFSLLMGLFTPLIIQLQTYFIDYATDHSDPVIAILAPSLVIYFVLNFIDFNSQNIVSYWNFKISSNIEKRVMKDYLERTSKLNYEGYESANNQDIIFRVGQTLMQVSAQGVNFVPTILRHAIELGGILYFVMLSGTWWIFPISVVLSIPSFYFNKKRVQYARKVWAKDNTDMRYSNYLHGVLVNKEAAKERKLFQFADYLSSRWDTVFKKYNKNKIVDYIKSSAATGAAMFFSMSNIVIFGLFLISPLQNNIITIGLYVSLLQMITNRFNASINTIIREVTNLAQIKHFSKDLEDFKRLKYIDISANSQKVEFNSLRFDNVYFCYPNTERYILNGVTFEIKRGAQYALLGVNGAGKTTITKLMLGLYSPTRGHIYINDIDITEYSYDQLRSFFVCIQQEPVNYKMTARENIGLFQMELSDNDSTIDGVLRQCNILDLKSKLKDGYNTNLTPELEDGVLLSGGEWQKIAIARSLFSKREFCILDEPTAALDPLAEVEFYKNYKSLMQNKTCLYITHRLGSTHLFDKCMLLNDGVITEIGSHSELMGLSNGIYKELYNKQKAWYDIGDNKNEVC